MDIFNLEDQKNKLNSELKGEKFPINRLELLNSFMSEVLKTNDKFIIEAYLAEFLSEYKTTLSYITPFGLRPQIVQTGLQFFEELTSSLEFSKINQSLAKEIERIQQDYQYVMNVLNGNEVSYNKNQLSFPVNIHSQYSNTKFGQLETFTVKIHRDSTLTSNKFIIIPSKEKIDARLERQINTSWELALDYLKGFFKYPKSFHEIILIFEHKYAEIEGFSLGLSITLGFIQELFKYYNTSLSLELKANVTFTGGISNDRKVIPLGQEIIESKVETVFFSYLDVFAIPESDYVHAKEKLVALKEIYPNRNLKIIPIDDLDDLIDHRQIIKIEKAKVKERSAKFVKSHALSILLTMILLLILGTFSVYSIDNNPSEFQIVGESLNILNKSGRLLWSKSIALASKERSESGRYFQKIYDINNDGLNEVILAHENLEKKDIENHGRIACFDYEGNLIWKYKFRDTISTLSESYSDLYISRMIDVVEENGRTILFCIARHVYFPSAIYPLDIVTGQRLEGLLWSQGHFIAGNVGDYDKDGEKEIFIGGINNGLEMAFACIINVNNLSGQTPTTEKYLFNNIKTAKFKKYFIFPKTDICIYAGRRFNGTELTNFNIETKTYHVGVNEKFDNQGIGPYYVFNYNLDSVHLQIGDAQQFTRDSLIIKGLLNPPFTTDPEYEKIVLSGIKEWNGKEFIPFIMVK